MTFKRQGECLSNCGSILCFHSRRRCGEPPPSEGSQAPDRTSAADAGRQRRKASAASLGSEGRRRAVSGLHTRRRPAARLLRSQWPGLKQLSHHAVAKSGTHLGSPPASAQASTAPRTQGAGITPRVLQGNQRAPARGASPFPIGRLRSVCRSPRQASVLLPAGRGPRLAQLAAGGGTRGSPAGVIGNDVRCTRVSV